MPCRHGISCWWARHGCHFQHEERDFVWKEIAQFHNLCCAQQCASDVDESYDQPTKNLDVDEANVIQCKKRLAILETKRKDKCALMIVGNSHILCFQLSQVTHVEEFDVCVD